MIPRISVIIPLTEQDIHLYACLKSLEQQTFSDFEIIIAEIGTTDNLLKNSSSLHSIPVRIERGAIIRSEALNRAIRSSKGKYIAFIDPEDYVNIDRLHIQYTTMEENLHIDICCSWITHFGSNEAPHVRGSYSGVINNLLVFLFKSPFICFSTVFIRKSLLDRTQINFTESLISDYRFWVELSKYNPILFCDVQTLVYVKKDNSKVSAQDRMQYIEAERELKKEIIEYWVDKYRSCSPSIEPMYRQACLLNNEKYIDDAFFLSLFYHIFEKISITNQYE